MPAGHGPNLGHGYVKYVVIDQHGAELPPVVFPAQIARAGRQVTGALGNAPIVDIGGGRWWVGEHADLDRAPLTLLAQERLQDPAFIPALLRGALDRFGTLNGSATGPCVTGLPATWAADLGMARQLGQRLREAWGYSQIKVIPEPLGLVYAALLDNDGQIVGDSALASGRVGVVDLGHLTIDIAVLRGGVPEKDSLDTWQLGTKVPLVTIRGKLAAQTGRELTIVEADHAVRARAIRVAGQVQPLQKGWDRPLIEHGPKIAAKLVEAWGNGASLDAILVGGGGAESEPLAAAIRQRFPHAQIVDEPQTAIARGYARLARRMGGQR